MDREALLDLLSEMVVETMDKMVGQPNTIESVKRMKAEGKNNGEIQEALRNIAMMLVFQEVPELYIQYVMET